VGLSRDEHLIAVENAIIELADRLATPADYTKYPGITALRQLQAERKAYAEYENSRAQREIEQRVAEWRVQGEAAGRILAERRRIFAAGFGRPL
jgi:hypothetical protein